MISAAGAGRGVRAALVVAVVVAVLAGCYPAAPAPRPTPTDRAQPQLVAPQSPLVVPRVLAYCPLVDAVHYSGYPLVIDEVYICRGDGRHASDGVTSYGPWESASRIDHPAALLKAYGVPNARKSRGTCMLVGRDPLIIWVHRNGVTAAYYAPVDECGSPSRAAAAAYRKAKRTLLVDVDRGAPDVSTTTDSKKDATG